VRDRIIRGELAIGQVISRRKLATELGMSFLPVTEALIRLENEGLLESRPRAGTRVKVPTRQDVEGHYVMREALETQAAMLFAERAASAASDGCPNRTPGFVEGASKRRSYGCSRGDAETHSFDHRVRSATH